MKKIIIWILIILCVVVISVFLYFSLQKPDLIIEKVSLLPNSMTITIRNIGKKDAVGKIYICATDMGSEKHIQETVNNFTCGHEELANMDTMNGTSKELSLISIKAGESIDVWYQRMSYFGPLYIAVDRANEQENNNLIKESDETNNLYIIKQETAN
jgi:hypothetical protein